MFLRTADENYIAARACFFAGMGESFFWLSSQSIEKYTKAILLLCGGHAKYGHDVRGLCAEVERVLPEAKIPPFEYSSLCSDIDVFEENGWHFLLRISQYGSTDNRYGVYGYDMLHDDIFKLDHLVFHFRRLCRQRYTYHPFGDGRLERIDWYEMALQHGHWSIDPLGVLEKALQENRYLNSWIIENSRTANFAFLGEKAPPWKRLSSGSHVGAFVDWMFPTAEDSCSAAELGASEEVLRWALDKIQLSRAFADKLRIALQGAGRGSGGASDPPSGGA